MNNTQTSEHVRDHESAGAQPEIQTTLSTPAQPIYPTWPTSRPGPSSKQPSAKMRSINAFRPEQFAEIGYDQATGEPAEADPQRY